MPVKGIHRKITLMMMLAFLMNAMIPPIALAISSENGASDQGDLTGLESLIGERFIICTPDGIKWVTWAELEAAQSDGGSVSAPKCTLCVLPTFGTTVGNILLEVMSLPELLETQFSHFYPVSDGLKSDILRQRGSYGRAPPLFI